MFENKTWLELRKKYRFVGRRTVLGQKKHMPRGTTTARMVLIEHGRDLKVCENCESRNTIQVHHKDGNPNNNLIENLVVLCKLCHKRAHNLDFGVIEEGDDVEIER